jgi:prepilin-type N-terminal cleavage/methylation domain-containing protein
MPETRAGGAAVPRPLYALILAGGSGTRLWPYSRRRRPKQLLPLIGEDSLLQATVRRTEGIAGFTLAEMLVVIGIIVVISSIVLANNNRFGGVVQLQNLAYDIALSIRQAQVYGISVQRFNTTTTFAPAYGMHFQMSAPNTYVLFGDVNDPINGVYDPGGAIPELVQSTTIQSGYAVSALYATPAGGVETSVASLDITYRRPDPDAYISRNGDIFTFNSKGKLTSGNLNEQARIEVQSPRGDLKSIVISSNGQISVQ